MFVNTSRSQLGRIIPYIYVRLLIFQSISPNSPILPLTITMRKVRQVFPSPAWKWGVMGLSEVTWLGRGCPSLGPRSLPFDSCSVQRTWA